MKLCVRHHSGIWAESRTFEAFNCLPGSEVCKKRDILMPAGVLLPGSKSNNPNKKATNAAYTYLIALH
jgi:hypothetical protein